MRRVANALMNVGTHVDMARGLAHEAPAAKNAWVLRSLHLNLSSPLGVKLSSPLSESLRGDARLPLLGHLDSLAQRDARLPVA